MLTSKSIIYPIAVSVDSGLPISYLGKKLFNTDPSSQLFLRFSDGITAAGIFDVHGARAKKGKVKCLSAPEWPIVYCQYWHHGAEIPLDRQSAILVDCFHHG